MKTLTNSTALFITLLLSAASVSAQDCNRDLFFSEYVEGTGFNKALEIYNPSSNEIDLAAYSVLVFPNGGVDASFNITLEGTLASGEVYVIVDPRIVDDLGEVADLGSPVTSFNGDDAIRLLKDGFAIDTIGVVGERR